MKRALGLAEYFDEFVRDVQAGDLGGPALHAAWLADPVLSGVP